MTNDPKSIALAYLDAVGRKDFAALDALLAPDVQFKGPAMTLTGAREYVSALGRLAPILVRNTVKRAFADGAEVCLIYDFVTDTAAGAVPTVEWLRVEEGRIRSITLYYDRVTFKPVFEEIGRRAQQASSAS